MKTTTLFCLFFITLIVVSIVVDVDAKKKDKEKDNKEERKEKDHKEKKHKDGKKSKSSNAAEEPKVGGSAVRSLNTDAFDELIPKSEFVLVEFYTDWCAHCKNFAPEYERAAKMLKSQKSPVIVAKVNGEVENSLTARFNINGFPSILFFRKDKAGISYTGGRMAEDVVNWVNKRVSGAATVFRTDEELTEYLTSEEEKTTKTAIVIGRFDEDSQGLKNFLAAADSPQLEDVRFVVRHVQGSDAQAGQIELKRSFDKDVTMDVSDDTDTEAIIAYILGNGYPYLESAQLSWGRLRETGNPIGLVIYDDKGEDAAAVEQVITRAAKALPGKVGFASVEATYVEKAKELGVTGERVPTVILMHPMGHNYLFPDELSLLDKEGASSESNEFIDWLKRVFAGEVKKHFKSKPVPTAEENTGPVKIIVGHSFNDTVLDEEKNVLVEFYAPWCGHCKTLAPIYEEVGKYFVDSEYKDIEITKIDAAANDNDLVKIAGFPTLYLFKSGNKSTPVEYRGQRTKEDLIAFVLRETGRGDVKDAAVPPPTPKHDEL